MVRRYFDSNFFSASAANSALTRSAPPSVQVQPCSRCLPLCPTGSSQRSLPQIDLHVSMMPSRPSSEIGSMDKIRRIPFLLIVLLRFRNAGTTRLNSAFCRLPVYFSSPMRSLNHESDINSCCPTPVDTDIRCTLQMFHLANNLQ